jgi:20S proteasome alpha/beta subunit
MTLCIAANCLENRNPDRARIVISADARSESTTIGGDNTSKYEILTDGLWAMFAGEISKARDLTSTFREVLSGVELKQDTLFEKLNEASGKHKGKLCDRMAQQRFGLSYRAVRERGEQELPENNRARFFHDLESLGFDCELLIIGFLDEGRATIFHVAHDGEVTLEDNFRAIGTGETIAEGNLSFRNQRVITTVEETIYHVYESTRLAYEAKTPGVGKTDLFFVLAPKENGKLEVTTITPDGQQKLGQQWERFGPRAVASLSRFEPDDLLVLSGLG